VVDASSRLAAAIAQEYLALTQKLNALPPNMARVKKEVEEQLALLLPKKFFSQTPWERLQHLPRYLKALKLRLDKYPSAIDRDAKSAQNVQMVWQRWQDKVTNLRKANLEVSEALADYRWMIEELRVSLFAQELKTPFPVSTKRLDKIWDDFK
jgi:ATP-dependent helicase HrpA